MPINSKHHQWENTVYSWQKVFDVMGGEKLVKGKNTKYLDMPAGMIKQNKPVSSGGTGTESEFTTSADTILPGDFTEYDPTWHPNPAYRAYLRRAYFPDITAFTVRGLVGIAAKKDSEYEIPSNINYLEKKFTVDGKTLDEFYKYCLNQVLRTGRMPCVIDLDPEDKKLRVVSYDADSLINWGDGFYNFEETYVKNKRDMFENEVEPQWRTLFIDKDGFYAVGKTKNEAAIEPEEVVVPDLSGKKMKEIPIVIIGSTNLESNVDQIPIESIADCAIQIYKKTADLSNSQYMSCNPTLVLSGIDKSDAPSVIGSTVAIVLESSDAKAYYTITDTSALSHVQNDIDKMFERAANFGAQLLGSAKKGAEAAETVRLQQSAGGATLSGVVDTVSSGIEKLIQFIADWNGTTGEVSYSGSKEFSDMTFSAAELKEVRESWMSGGSSQETYLFNLKRAGLLPEDIDVEDELSLIDLGNTPPSVEDEGDIET